MATNRPAFYHSFSELPYFIRGPVKKLYWKIRYFYNKINFIEKGKYCDLGCHFRFTLNNPYRAFIDDQTAIDEFNVWSAKFGDISVGKNCWIGLHNIIIGPVEIGDKVRTGPHVSILGPHHAIHNYENRKDEKTIIGNNVWISTGAIVLFGIQIGDSAIIGPGSVVTKNVSANAYVAGNPARDITNMARFTSSARKEELK